MKPIERLSPEDEMMLWPDEIWPQDIGALVILDARALIDPDGRFRIEAVRKAVESRLHLVPRFRQLLHVPPRRLGAPLWVDAPSLDVAEHVRTLQVPSPGDEAQLLLTTEQLRRHRLDRSRPLWEMWFLTGLQEGRVGLFFRMHHTIADGLAGVATFASFLDLTPEAIAGSVEPWTPAPPPTEATLLADTRWRQKQRRREMLSRFAHPVTIARQLVTAWPAVRELLAERPLPATSLDRVVGPDRALALIRSRLDRVKAVAHLYDAKVNDVLLAVIAGGLRRLLSSRGEPVEGVVLRIFVPVTLRPREERAHARGNRISEMVVPLPIGGSDPAARLRQIAEETARRKSRVRPSLGVFPHRGIAGRAFLKLLARQRVNVSSTNIAGPDVPLYFAEARLLEVFPMVQLLGTNSLTVGAMSYAGRFDMMVVADRDAYPDLDVFTAGVRDELHALEALLRTSAVA